MLSSGIIERRRKFCRILNIKSLGLSCFLVYMTGYVAAQLLCLLELKVGKINKRFIILCQFNIFDIMILVSSPKNDFFTNPKK